MAAIVKASNPATPLAGARVVVGVTGGIAAYKAVELVRRLVDAGARVQVAMTPRAVQFVGPLTFQAVSGRPVFTDLVSVHEEATIGHIRVADEADLMIIAPASANTLARLAHGMADDPVTTVALATKAPVLVAPAMNVNMWAHPLTQRNLTTLTEVAGYHVVGPNAGLLACGWTGPGRMAEPDEVVGRAQRLLSPQDLAGLRVLISAGPTHEPIDPARYIANRSTGKMGVALANAARQRGATVTLILGPSHESPAADVHVVRIETAEALAHAMQENVRTSDIAVMAAAVADYRVLDVATQKRKRATWGATPTLALTMNPDVLAALGAWRGTAETPMLVGFAAETEEVTAHARAKLISKGCDVIVANDVSRADAGFAVDTNAVTLISAAGEEALPFGPKPDVAHAIWSALARHPRFPRGRHA